MNNRVLVTYATKYGSTAEIAVKIACILREAGLETDVLSLEQVKSVARYRAVIAGSAVYMGQWRKEMVAFLKGNQNALGERPVWIFSSGPTGEGDPDELLDGWRFPERLKDLIEDVIEPQEIVVFQGDLNINKLNILEKWIINNIKVAPGDYRDWRAIKAWANKIALELKKPEMA